MSYTSFLFGFAFAFYWGWLLTALMMIAFPFMVMVGLIFGSLMDGGIVEQMKAYA